MGRPRKRRRIGFKPNNDRYFPKKGKFVELKYEELESIRLIDYRGLTQKEAADLINIGRATLQAIYKNARKKLSIALIENYSIKYKNGDSYEFYSPKNLKW